MGLLLEIIVWMVGFSFPKFLIAMGTWILGRNFLFHFNPFEDWYNSLVCRYLTQLIAFDYDKAGNLGNLSCIDPSLLGIKDANMYAKNTLYLHGFSTPLLCFSLVLVTGDNHEYGHIMGSEPKEWVVKDILGVLPSMELECLVAVLGLAYELPYVPEDSACWEVDLLHFSISILKKVPLNPNWTTKLMRLYTFVWLKMHLDSQQQWPENLVRLFYFYVLGGHLCLMTEFYKATSSKSTPNCMNKMFAPASPTFSYTCIGCL